MLRAKYGNPFLNFYIPGQNIKLCYLRGDLNTASEHTHQHEADIGDLNEEENLKQQQITGEILKQLICFFSCFLQFNNIYIDL